MGWEKEYEHWRDYGHTWGPGIDDRREPTEEEIAANEAWWKEYEAKKDRLRVAPREKYVQAIKELDAMDTSSYQDLKKYRTLKLELCKQAAEELGYSLVSFNHSNRDKDSFTIKIEHHDDGRIYSYGVTGIKNINDCLQLTADLNLFSGWPNIWYKDYLYSTADTGELRIEMERWGFPLDGPDQVNEVSVRALDEKDKKPEVSKHHEKYVVMTENTLFSEYGHFLDNERMKDIDGHGYVLECHQRTAGCLIDVLKEQDIEVIRHEKDFYVRDPYDVFLQAEGKVVSFTDLPLEVRIKAAEKEVVRNDLAVKGERGQAR